MWHHPNSTTETIKALTYRLQMLHYHASYSFQNSMFQMLLSGEIVCFSVFGLMKRTREVEDGSA